MDGSKTAAQWLRLAQTVSQCGRQLRKALGELAAPRQLTDTECLVLWACCEAPAEGQAQHELASLVGVSPAQLSGLVEQLASRGWIIAWRPAHDRRRQYWRLSPAGRTVVAELLDDISAWLISGSQSACDDASHLLERVAQLAAATSPRAARRKEAA